MPAADDIVYELPSVDDTLDHEVSSSDNLPLLFTPDIVIFVILV